MGSGAIFTTTWGTHENVDDYIIQSRWVDNSSTQERRLTCKSGLDKLRKFLG